MIAVALITLLFLTDFKLAMIVGFTISGAYGLIFYFTKSYLNRLGKESLKNNQLRFTAVSEAFGAAKSSSGLSKIISNDFLTLLKYLLAIRLQFQFWSNT